MRTCVQYSPRKMQGEGYNGPITLSGYEKFKYLREEFEKRASISHCQRKIISVNSSTQAGVTGLESEVAAACGHGQRPREIREA